MSDTLYAGGYGITGKRCKFQTGNVVYLRRISAPLNVKNSTLAYQKQRGVVVGYFKSDYARYAVMFQDGHIAMVLPAMLKLIKILPDPGTFEGWENFVRPESFEFKTPKPNKADERRRLKQLERYGFRTTNLTDRKYDLSRVFSNIVKCDIIAQCPYYAAFDRSLYPLDDQSLALGISYDCIPILRVVYDVMNNGQLIDKRLTYITVTPGGFLPISSKPTFVRRDGCCLRVHTSHSLKNILNNFYNSKHMVQVSNAAARVADPKLGCVLDI